MSMIDIQNLSFTYEGSFDSVFEDVSFRIDTDWKLGFTGRNGRGKTTFLNLLRGKYRFQGKVKADTDFDYFPFEIDDEEKTPLDIAYVMVPLLEDWELIKELSLLDVDSEILYRPYSTLSHGERTKLMLAILFTKENNFLLIDEPTNHLDKEGRNKLSHYLKDKKGFIVVSHDRRFLDDTIDHVLTINKTSIDVQQGTFSSWWENKRRQDNFELNQNEKLQKDIKRLERAAKRSATWSDEVEKTKSRGKLYKGNIQQGVKPDKGYIGARSASMMQKSKNAENRKSRAAEDKKMLLKDLERNDPLSIKFERYSKERLINITNLSLKYCDSSDNIIEDLSLAIDQGDIVTVEGQNGSGKSSLIKAILGYDDVVTTGAIQVGSNLKISYVPQDTSTMYGNMRDYSENNDIDESQFKTILRKMDFPRVAFDKDMENLSQGQKKKILLARSLCEESHLYIWDEPLNYIDVFSRIQIEDLIKIYRPTMVLIEHDIAFIEAVTNKRVMLG